MSRNELENVLYEYIQSQECTTLESVEYILSDIIQTLNDVVENYCYDNMLLKYETPIITINGKEYDEDFEEN